MVGQPEFLPQHTFISLFGEISFLALAMNFHIISGLKPRTVGSIEEILELLTDSSKTGSGVLDRIRIVSHFFVPDPGEPEQPAIMSIKFFRNGGRGALKRHFEGFAESSVAGLRAVLTFDHHGFTQTSLSIFDSPYTDVLTALRTVGKGALVDQVFPNGQTPSANKQEFVIISACKWLLREHPDVLKDATLRANLASAYDLLLNDLKTRLVAPPDAVPAPQLDALRDAIVALGDFATIHTITPDDIPRYAANVAAVLPAVTGDSFRNIMLAARQRFDRFTTIDIRGCRAGTDTPYLAAVQRFFGRSDTVRPVITAPDFFQRFNQIAMIRVFGTTPQAAAGVINQLHNNGVPLLFNRANVQDQFATWSDGFGITTAHLTFWQNTFQLGVLEFSKLLWRQNIPACKVTTSRLDAMATAAFEVVFDQLGEIFFVRVGDRPTAAQIAAIKPRLASLDTWTTQLNAAIPAGSTPTELTAHFNNFKTIYEVVEIRMGNAAFRTSPLRVIPSMEPAGLTAAQATKLQGNLRTFIQADNNSLFAPVRIFLANADARTQDAPARMRYFLGLGLVFQLSHATDVSFDSQRIVMLDDRTGPDAARRQHEAIRHWVRASWRGINPPTIVDNLDFELGRHSAWVVAGREQGPCGVCPHPSYMQHIVILPA